jgi:hypothetical protein
MGLALAQGKQDHTHTQASEQAKIFHDLQSSV